MNITIAGLKMWETVAEYADGTSVRRLFAYSEGRNENDQQYDLECWLLERHPGCTWYSVNYIEE